MDCSRAGSSVHGVLQARILEWVVIPFSRGSSQHRDRAQVSCIAGGFFTLSHLGRVTLLAHMEISFTTYSLTLVFWVLGGESTLS